MYKCLECGHIFEEGEQARWDEYRGECHGRVCHEEERGCPLCKGEYAPMIACKICDAYHLEEEMVCDVCEECIDKYKKNFEICNKISSEITAQVELKAIYTYLFTSAEIEAILYNHIKSNCTQIDCEEFAENDISWFAQELIKEVKK